MRRYALKVLGLCGGSGAGKGIASLCFKKMGIKIIDTDSIYHQLTSCDTPCLREIGNAFGQDVISNNTLNRRMLANIVFASQEKLLLLNNITHKHILNVVKTEIATAKKQSYKGVVIDAPVLFESGFDQECDFTLCICSTTENRIERIIKRDGISKENALKRINAQKSNSWLKENCDYSIDNDSSVEDFETAVLELADKIFDK